MEKAQREKLVSYDCEVRVWTVREGRELFLSRIASVEVRLSLIKNNC